MKPCPFCGGEAEYDNSDHGHSEWIYCTNCGAKGPTNYDDADPPILLSAHELWDMRMPNYTFTGWVRQRVTFRIQAKDRQDAKRRAQLGNYDSFDPVDGVAPDDFRINVTQGQQEEP